MARQPKGMQWEQARFSLESDQTFTGWHQPGNTWNGWANPHFEYDQAVELLKAWKGIMSYDYADREVYPADAWYEPFTDTFYFWDLDAEEPDVTYGCDMLINGEWKHVYAIGYACFCWTAEPLKQEWEDFIHESCGMKVWSIRIEKNMKTSAEYALRSDGELVQLNHKEACNEITVYHPACNKPIEGLAAELLILQIYKGYLAT